MRDSVQADDGGQGRNGEAVRWPYPELPDDVAIAGRKRGKLYLHRPGELIVDLRELERDGGRLRRRLEQEFGAVALTRPPSRTECHDRATLLVDRDPTCDAVQRACRELKDLPKAAKHKGDVLDRLRDRLTARHTRLAKRADSRQDQAARLLAGQGFVMYRLPAPGPDVPKVLKALRKAGSGDAGVSANHVFTAQQDYEWVPATRPTRLATDLAPLPDERSAGKGVRVAVVDTGVRKAHKWLEASQVDAADYEELDEDGDLEFDLEAGHGTFIAGVVLQQAPGATIVGRSVVDLRGYVDELALATALDSLRGACIDIVTLSVGGPADPRSPAKLVRRSIDTLRSENPRLTVVAAAGNRNRSDELFYPAAFSDVIAVGALDHDLLRAPFSNYGPWVNAWALGVGVDSSFVGRDVTATVDTDPGGLDGACGSGTSFAAPRVAGAIAAAMRPGR